MSGVMHKKKQHPTLPKLAFAAAPILSKRLSPLLLVDSHLHLWGKELFDQDTFSTQSERTLPGQADLKLYSELVTSAVAQQWDTTELAGFVYVQAEANHDDADHDGSAGGWDCALREIEDVCRQALETPSPKLLALVPWAPVQHGPKALELFTARLEALPSLIALTKSSGGPKSLIKGFRYLLQDSPKGFSLQEPFVEGLKWLGERDYAFDLCLDVIGRGPQVLEEAVELISRVHAGQTLGHETKFILDHLAKPDLISDPTLPLSEAHSAYVRSFYDLALLPSVSVKFSGLLDYAPAPLVKAAFAEFCANPLTAAKDLKPGTPRRPSVSSVAETPVSEVGHQQKSTALATLKRKIVTFLEPLLEAFGDSRIVIGSDWPMFRHVLDSKDRKPIADEAQLWSFQLHLYRLCLLDLGLEGEALDAIFAGNAKSFYNIA